MRVKRRSMISCPAVGALVATANGINSIGHVPIEIIAECSANMEARTEGSDDSSRSGPRIVIMNLLGGMVEE